MSMTEFLFSLLIGYVFGMIVLIFFEDEIFNFIDKLVLKV